VAFNGARMSRDLGYVLVVDDAQLECVSLLRANVVLLAVFCASIGWLCVVCVLVEWFLDGCGKWNSY
jgi:hypothetical protein